MCIRDRVKTGQGGFLVRSDGWLRMMGVFLVIVAVILIIRSFGKKEGEEAEGFHFYLDSTVVAVSYTHLQIQQLIIRRNHFDHSFDSMLLCIGDTVFYALLDLFLKVRFTR